MHTLQGQYIWIIGASSGIGAALAKELAAQGAILALSARRKDKLEALYDQLPGKGHRIIPADVGSPENIEDAKYDILRYFPRIDSAIFMAAIYSPHDNRQKPIAFIHEMINVNLGGAFNMLNAIQPEFEKRQSGQIILCASVAGYRGLPTGQPYCATKAALINLAESLKIELEPKNIDVKVICPGFVKTPLTDKNDFSMPMIIPAETAARIIATEMCSNKFEIHFPKRFTRIMKMIKILPNWLYFMLAKKLRP